MFSNKSGKFWVAQTKATQAQAAVHHQALASVFRPLSQHFISTSYRSHSWMLLALLFLPLRMALPKMTPGWRKMHKWRLLRCCRTFYFSENK